jgi:hypothetical protein
MTDETREMIRALDRELDHACAIAIANIGKPGWGQNVAYHDEIEAKLNAAIDEHEVPEFLAAEEYLDRRFAERMGWR